MMEAYSVIAKFYDSANTDFDYSKYFEFIKHYFSGKVVELACGSLFVMINFEILGQKD